MITHTTNPATIGEAVTVTLAAVQTATTAFLMAVVPPEQVELMSWTLLPMVGATIASGGAFCLNTQTELRRYVIGRCLFALVVGVVGPRLTSMIHPWVSGMMVDPILKVGAGFVFGFVGYVVSWPFVKKFYDRAPNTAAELVKAVEANMVHRIRTGVASDAAVVAKEVAKELAEHDHPTQTAVQVAAAISHAAKEVSTHPQAK